MEPDQGQSQTSWQFVPGDESQASPQNDIAPQGNPFSWSASEFVAYHKNFGWYLLMILAIAAVTALLFLITRDFISVVSITILGILFLIFASRKPRVLQYSIDEQGVTIGQKLYSFKELRSFAVIDEGTLRSISLFPLKRFMPPISIYYEPQDEITIIEILGSSLPKEDKNQDMVDRLMHKIRF